MYGHTPRFYYSGYSLSCWLQMSSVFHGWLKILPINQYLNPLISYLVMIMQCRELFAGNWKWKYFFELIVACNRQFGNHCLKPVEFCLPILPSFPFFAQFGLSTYCYWFSIFPTLFTRLTFPSHPIYQKFHVFCFRLSSFLLFPLSFYVIHFFIYISSFDKLLLHISFDCCYAIVYFNYLLHSSYPGSYPSQVNTTSDLT